MVETLASRPNKVRTGHPVKCWTESPKTLGWATRLRMFPLEGFHESGRCFTNPLPARVLEGLAGGPLNLQATCVLPRNGVAGGPPNLQTTCVLPRNGVPRPNFVRAGSAGSLGADGTFPWFFLGRVAHPIFRRHVFSHEMGCPVLTLLGREALGALEQTGRSLGSSLAPPPLLSSPRDAQPRSSPSSNSLIPHHLFTLSLLHFFLSSLPIISAFRRILAA
jgi:hypothetical protein